MKAALIVRTVPVCALPAFLTLLPLYCTVIGTRR
jgi:hypothetical protein